MSEKYRESDEWKEWEAWLESRQAPEFVDLPETSPTVSPEIYKSVRRLHFKNFDAVNETYPDAVVLHSFKTEDHKGPEGRDDEESLRARESVATILRNDYFVPEEYFVPRQHSRDFHPEWNIPRFVPNHYTIITVRRHEIGNWEIAIVAQPPNLDTWAKQFTGWKFFAINNDVVADRVRGAVRR